MISNESFCTGRFCWVELDPIGDVKSKKKRKSVSNGFDSSQSTNKNALFSPEAECDRFYFSEKGDRDVVRRREGSFWFALAFESVLTLSERQSLAPLESAAASEFRGSGGREYRRVLVHRPT